MKFCTRCKSNKELTEFGKNRRTKDGLSVWCKPCCSEHGKLQYAKSKERVLEYQKQYRKLNLDKVRQTKKIWKAKNKEKVSDINRWSKRKQAYGITKDQFFDLLEKQNNGCAICSKPVGISSAVDHDHDTGKVRGILCDPCNTSLGIFGDNLQGIMNVVSYLERASGSEVTGSP